jgi:PAS domain S-box-containing protein
MTLPERTSILLVDDRPENLLTLEAVLSDLGENLVRATSGREALELVEQQDFAVVLLDVQMPHLDGFETARLLRAHERAEGTPIIFITAINRSEERIAAGYAAGAVDYIYKPFDPDVLRAKVGALVAAFKRGQAVARASEAQLRLITDAVPALIAYVDAAGRYHLNNRAYETWFGLSREEIHGRHMREVLGEAAWETIRPHVEAALSGREVTYEAETPYKTGGTRWVDATYIPDRGEDGQVRGFVVLVNDITDRKRAEQAGALLSEASDLLASSLDFQTTLQSVARLAVPTIADWCAVDMLDESGTLHRLAVAHADPAKVELAYEIQRRYPVDPGAPYGVPQVLRTGQAEFYPEIPDALLVEAARDTEHLRMMRDLGLRSGMVVPLVARGRTLGAITLISAESGRAFTREDLALAQDLAHRSAIAVDNARLYQAAQEELEQRKRLEDELRQRVEELAEADRRKDAFLAMLGHELRNPLGAASNALHLMRRAAPGSTAFERAREVAVRQVLHQTRIVDDLLDVSRIASGRIELHHERLDLVRVAQEAVEDQRPSLEAAALTLALELPHPEGTRPVQVLGDRTRLTQIMGNLLDNARKFTPAGGTVTVRVTLGKDEGGRMKDEGGKPDPLHPSSFIPQPSVVVTVTDTGVGIDSETQRHLFEPFAQADRSLDRSRGGLGLGLALVKGLVELHGGRVTAHSAGPGRGAEFTFTLPVASEPPVLQEAPAPAHAAPRGLRILVVEDNQDTAETLRDLLELHGYEVEIAYTGAEGLRMARALRPQVILCDIGLPGISGYEVAEELRRDPTTAASRLIAVTGYGGDEDRRLSEQAGFDLHLTKPVDPMELQEALARAILN